MKNVTPDRSLLFMLGFMRYNRNIKYVKNEQKQ